MNAIGTNLKDSFLITTEVFHDSRGSFSESFNLREIQKIIGPYQFVQDCYSVSKQNVVRGLHYQIEHPQGKLIKCLSGKVYDVIVDLRKSSSTFGKWIATNLSPSSPQLWVPPGFAHGFRCLSEEAVVLYKVTDYQYRDYERTLMWNDSDLNIDWGEEIEPIMSEKDTMGIQFSECEKYD